MPQFTNFTSNPESLQDLLQSIRLGRTQLPDFQRGWVWDDEHIKSLLASVAVSFPIGTVMLLQTGNPQVRFKPRLVEGVDSKNFQEPERLILDGQQRLTSLFQVLLSGKAVTTRDARGKQARRWYYLDINKALASGAEIDEAIVSVPEDKIILNFRREILADYSTRQKECEAEMFPLSILFDNVEYNGWWFKYVSQDFQRSSELSQSTHFQDRHNKITEILQRYQQYLIPVISLSKDTPREAVCQVFEKVNTGGVSLNVFELVTATYAADNFNLREDWAAHRKQLHQYRVLRGLESTDFLQAVSLLATYHRRNSIAKAEESDKLSAISCTRKDILKLALKDYKDWASKAANGFIQAAKLLQSHYIFTERDLPYRSQLVPLATIFTVLGEDAQPSGARSKLMRWFWCGVFGELYGSSIETRFARDLPEVVSWVRGDVEPSTVSEASFSPTRLMSLRSRNSAAYKGVFALLMNEQAQDFRTGVALNHQIFFDEQIDIHHIFPQRWCRENNIDTRYCDSIINKTPISAKTNRMIGGKAPSKYLPRIAKSAQISEEQLAHVLQSHLINPELLAADDFDTFFKAREDSLLSRIELAMGKPIAREVLQIDELEDDEVVAECDSLPEDLLALEEVDSETLAA